MNQVEKSKYRKTKRWKDFRRKIIKTRFHKCECCQSTYFAKRSRLLQVHHLNPEHTYGHEKEEDVILLCKSCHTLLHKFLAIKAFDLTIFLSGFRDIYLKSKNK